MSCLSYSLDVITCLTDRKVPFDSIKVNLKTWCKSLQSAAETCSDKNKQDQMMSVFRIIETIKLNDISNKCCGRFGIKSFCGIMDRYGTDWFKGIVYADYSETINCLANIFQATITEEQTSEMLSL